MASAGVESQLEEDVVGMPAAGAESQLEHLGTISSTGVESQSDVVELSSAGAKSQFNLGTMPAVGAESQSEEDVVGWVYLLKCLRS